MRRRRRGAPVPFWSDEAFYCDARRALRLPNFEKYGFLRGGCLENPQGVFRRLLCNGGVTVRVEAGISVIPRGPIAGNECIALARRLLDLPTEVIQPEHARAKRSLFSQGANLARLFLHASTSTVGDALPSPPFDLVQPASPMLLIEYEPVEVRSLPSMAQVLDSDKVSGLSVAFTRLLHEGKEVGIWFIRNDSTSRRARLTVFRLYVEHQVLGRVLRQIARNSVSFKPHSNAGDRLQEYLNEATRLVAGEEWQGLELSPFRDIVTAYDELIGPQERGLLIRELQGVRRQILAKVQSSIDQKPRQPIQQIYYFSGDFIQNAETVVKEGVKMNVTNVNLGAGASFTGDIATAENIKNSFNKASSSDVSDSVQSTVKDLVAQVAKLCEKLDAPKAQAVSRDLETFVKEVTSPQPCKDWLKVTGQGLVEAAKTVAEMSGPVVTAVAAVLKIFGIAAL